jgi:excisionase family DNA binding protein
MASPAMLTPRQAAEKLGISYPALEHWILAGRIRSTLHGDSG